ncbi:hypothetical protein ACHAWF_013109 [Thalassiosira exigua]
MPSSKRTKHIKKKYFFITDKIEQGEVQVEHHIPTVKMWIDSHTKPTMGRRYCVDRSHVMGCPVNLPESIADRPM